MRLRWYQEAAVQAVWDFIRANPGKNPCVELPTGAGKSLVISKLMMDTAAWNGRAILLAHRKELLEQTEDKIKAMAPELDVGVYSAGLNRRDTDNQIILAGIQSVHKRADELGAAQVILVDEAHLIPKGGDGMFQTFLGDMQVINPKVRLVGLTATPYRMEEGMVCGPDHLLHDICYRVGVRELINEGFLCPLTSKATSYVADADGVGKRGGEYIASQLSHHLADEEKVQAACQEILAKAKDRHSVLVFCAGRDHAQMVYDHLSKSDGHVAYLDGDTPAGERAKIIEAFRCRVIKYLVNIDVLTTGFDATCVDCVALLRPTMSPGLYYQMVGRGLRIDSSNDDCLVLDFGENVKRHGPIDMMDIKAKDSSSSGGGEAVTKTCPKCQEIVHAATRLCTGCRHEFPPPETKHHAQADDTPVLSTVSTPQDQSVMDVSYNVHIKMGDPSATKTMRVDYQLSYLKTVSEWVCIEHDGFARNRAELWWAARCHRQCPDTVEEAVTIARMGLLAHPITVQVDESGKWPQITKVVLRDKPEWEPGIDPREHPYVQEDIDLFDGEVTDVRF